MGAWGHGHFENDDASDWLYELEASGDLSVVITALDAVSQDPADYVESPTCCNALAAAEIVAALNGKPSSNLPEIAGTWVRGKPEPGSDAVSKARAAVERIRTNSELRELWEESDDFENWLKVVDDVHRRL